MKNIVVMMQKGGVGKTAIADELAYSMDRTGVSYEFYDLDPQHTALHGNHRDQEAVVSIVDTKPGIDSGAIENIQDADLIVIPTKASIDDQTALERTRKLVHQTKAEVPVLIVQNMWNRYRNCRNFSEWLVESLGDKERTLQMNQTDWIPNSREAEKSIIELAPKRARVRGQLMKIINTARLLVGLEEEF